MAQQRPPNHVNPFYIEPSSSSSNKTMRDRSWNGDWRYGDVDLEDDVDYDPDYYYSDDDEYVEREDLLLNGNATNRDMGEYGRRRKRSGSDGGGGGGHHRPQLLSPRLCVAASIVFMLFFVVLSSLSSGGKTKTQSTDKPSVPPPNNTNSTASSALPQQQPSSPSSSSSSGGTTNTSNNAEDKATTSAEEEKEEAEKKESETTAETSSSATAAGDGNGSSSSSNADQTKDKPSDQEKEEEEQPTNSANTTEQKQFHVIVLGERHSGLDQLLAQVSNCFSTAGTSNNSTFTTTTRIQSGYVRPGYWFQYNPTGVLSESKRKEQQLLAKNSTIVLYAIRHPVSWFEAMRKQPIKMPNHYNYDSETSSSQPLDWQSFINKPLTMDRPSKDSYKKPSESCQLSFEYSEVLPCHPVSITQSPDDKNGISIEMIGNLSAPVDSDAVYELKKDGGGKSSQPYDNILQLRTDKIKHVMQQLPNNDDGWLKQSLLRKKSPGDTDKAKEKMALFVVNYEQQRTVASAIKKIRSITEWKRTCEISDIIGLDQEQQGEKDNTLSSSLITDDDEFIQAVSDLIDWDTERLVGYTEGSHPW